MGGSGFNAGAVADAIRDNPEWMRQLYGVVGMHGRQRTLVDVPAPAEAVPPATAACSVTPDLNTDIAQAVNAREASPEPTAVVPEAAGGPSAASASTTNARKRGGGSMDNNDRVIRMVHDVCSDNSVDVVAAAANIAEHARELMTAYRALNLLPETWKSLDRGLKELYSIALDDGWHAINRVRVPLIHAVLENYKYCLS